METVLFRCLETNVGILIKDNETGEVAAIDIPDAQAVHNVLTEKKWNLDHILITHSHSDHVQGLEKLQKLYDCRVVAPEKSIELIKKADLWVGEGDIIRVGDLHFTILATLGHSQDHITYWLEQEAKVFVGDVLFVMGCGRVFGGDYKGMWSSLERLMQLPDYTEVYCGHDYSLSNGRFALSIEPHNKDIEKRLHQAEEMAKVNEFIMPTTLLEEKKTNPFLRVFEPEIAQALGMEMAQPEDIFKTLRDRKDHF